MNLTGGIVKKLSGNSDIEKNKPEMIKHIVMWTIREGDTPRMKFERMAEVKSRLLALKDRIPQIITIEVCFNSPMANKNNHDVALLTEFNTWSDLETYQNHPAHLEVSDYLTNVRSARASIDYEF